MKKPMFSIKALLLATVFASQAFSAPVQNERHSFIQPDSSFVPVIVNGDEYYQQVEDLQGRTLVRDSEGWICYASLNSDSTEFIPGERYTGQERSVRSGEDLHINLKSSAIAEKSQEMRNFYFRDDMSRSGSRLTPIPVTGDRVGVTILIDFSDQPAIVSKSEVEQMLNGNSGATVKNFFSTASGGKLSYTNKVVGYYRARNPKTYYDTNQSGGRTRELLKEALDWLDGSGFDFGSVSSTNRTITAVNFLYAGGPSNGWAKGLWPHMAGYQWTGRNSGYSTSVYQITGLNTQTKTIGTFCHENGHMLLRYPDLYPYDQGTNWVKSYCLMSSGGHGNTPMPPNPYFRSESGWLDLEDITNVDNATIELTSNDPSRAIVYRNTRDSQKMLILESIQKTGQYSYYAPGSGMVAYKINTAGDNQQSNQNRPLVEVAGGPTASALMSNRPGIAFSATTSPAAKWPLGGSADIVLKNLSRSGSTMTFDIGDGGTVETMFSLSTIAENGTITLSPAGPRFKEGTEVTVTAAPADGYAFENWGGALTGTTNPTTIIMSDDKSITANFKMIPLDYIPMPSGSSNEAVIMGDTLFYDNGGPSKNYTDVFEGTLTLKPGVAGKSVKLEFVEFAIEDSSTPSSGSGGPIWDTLNVYDGSGVTNSLGRWFGNDNPGTLMSTTDDGALTVTFYADEATNGAGWKAKVSLVDQTPTHSLNITAANGTVKAIPAKDSYEQGDVVKLVPTAAQGYFFTGWGGEKTGFDDTLTVTIDGSVNVDAYFHKKALDETSEYGIAGGNRAIDETLNLTFHAYSYAGGTVDTSAMRTENGIVVPYTVPKQTVENEYPGAAVATYVEQSLKEVKYIRIRYRCGSKTNVQLTSTDKDAAPYIFPLKATTEFVTVDLPVSEFTPAGWGTVAQLSLENVENVAIAPDVDAATGDEGTIEISELYLIGVTKADPVALGNNVTVKHNLGVTMNQGKLMVSLPSAGNFSLQIFSVNGRMIHSISGEAQKAGLQQVNLPLNSMAKGVFVTRLSNGKKMINKLIMFK